MFKDNNLSFEKYQSLKRSNELNKLRLHKVHIHESACRYALVDNLVNDFDWHYWIVITFGYSQTSLKPKGVSKMPIFDLTTGVRQISNCLG